MLIQGAPFIEWRKYRCACKSPNKQVIRSTILSFQAVGEIIFCTTTPSNLNLYYLLGTYQIMGNIRNRPSVRNINEWHSQDDDVKDDEAEHVSQPQASRVHPRAVRIWFTVSTGDHGGEFKYKSSFIFLPLRKFPPKCYFTLTSNVREWRLFLFWLRCLNDTIPISEYKLCGSVYGLELLLFSAEKNDVTNTCARRGFVTNM